MVDPCNQTTPALSHASRRLLAMVLVAGLTALYFGSFSLAEGDAYGTPEHPRDGYVHAPWFLGMPLALVLMFSSFGLVERLWKSKP